MAFTQTHAFFFTICSMWCALDILTIIVVVQSTTPTTDAKYLTTQAWLFGFIAKICLIWQLLCPPPTQCMEFGLHWMRIYSGWITFLLFGTLQVAVLFTFFALLAMHSMLLKYAMHKYNISIIITWNHLRHVTPVFFYLMSMHYLAPELAKQMGLSQQKTVFGHQRLRLLLIVITLALFFGLLHHYIFDDDVLYMYRGGHPDVGRNCAMVFVVSVMTSSVYIISHSVFYWKIQFGPIPRHISIGA